MQNVLRMNDASFLSCSILVKTFTCQQPIKSMKYRNLHEPNRSRIITECFLPGDVWRFWNRGLSLPITQQLMWLLCITNIDLSDRWIKQISASSKQFKKCFSSLAEICEAVSPTDEVRFPKFSWTNWELSRYCHISWSISDELVMFL